MQTPLIDPRSRQEVATQLKELAQSLSGWTPNPNGPADAGEALIEIFARYSEIIIERINLLPENKFLAFLNLIGAKLSPPIPARVPLTFSLAANSPVDALVPRGTQVSAPPAEGEEEEVVFETVQELLVTQAQLTAVFSRQPALATDTYDNHTAVATTPDNGAFSLFTASDPMPHWLYIGCPELAQLSPPGDLIILFQGETEELDKLYALPLEWQYRVGEIWHALAPEQIQRAAPLNNEWAIQLRSLPSLPASTVNGQKSSWLRCRPTISLPSNKADLPLDAFATGARNPVAASFPYFPFGEGGDGKIFYVNSELAFGRPGASAQLDVSVKEGAGSGNLTWQYMSTAPDNKTSSWRRLDVDDGSNGFTQNGRIQITIPADGSWNVGLHRNQSGRWLRCTASSSFTVAPEIEAITTALAWNLPEIQHVGVQLPEQTLSLPPAFGYLNQLQLDLSKDYLPFGEQPRFNDAFYFAIGEALAAGKVQVGDPISLAIDLSTPGIAGGANVAKKQEQTVQLLWEFWNGRIWQTLGVSSNTEPTAGSSDFGFQDGSYALTKTGKLQFRLPADIEPSRVNGIHDVWLRARISSGHYGQEASYEPYTITIQGNQITAYRLVPANYAPPLIKSLNINVQRNSALTVSHCLAENDFIFADHTSVNNSQSGFTPFSPTQDEEPTLYLCFDRPFANRSVTFYAAVASPEPADVAPDRYKEAANQQSPLLVWEYVDGSESWSRLAVIDETNGFTERGLIRFTGPAVFGSRTLFGQTGYWLRIRWASGTFAVPPQLRYFLGNTTWAEQVQQVRNEILGSGSDNPGQMVRFAQQPVLPGQIVEMREANLTEVLGWPLTAVSPATASTSDQEQWVNWHEVPDFYASGPTDPHYTLDRQTGEMRFGDGQNGRLPPEGQNNIRATHYRTGGGQRGNRPAQTIVQLKTSIPYLAEVINHEAATGGAEQESIEQVKRYAPRQLRHRDRAVTVEDVEDLAFAASSEVARAKTIPPQFRPMNLWLDPGKAPGELPIHQRALAGQMGLIIVPHSTAPRPVPTPALITRVQQYVQARAAATANLWVSGPNWVEVQVSTTIVPTSMATADSVGEAVRSTLTSYLHPLTGGSRGTGWAFGRQPYLSDLYALLESVPGVDHVRQLTIEELPQKMDTLGLVNQYLIYSGKHLVTVLNPAQAS